jgi:protein TonB
MYRSDLNTRDKGGAMAAVIAIHAGLAFAFLHISGTVDLAHPEDALQVFDITEIKPPPPPPPPVLKEQEQARPKAKEGAASPKNIKSEATPVVAPKPKIELPAPPKISVTETPREGASPTQGASDVRGPGTGAGGVGTGTGSGGAGSGTGGGGGGGQGSRPRLITRSLTQRDYPPPLRRSWPRGGRVLVIFNVQLDGRATDCRPYQSSGVAAIDQVTCSLVETRLRFAPARDKNGRPYVEKYAYMQAPVNF